MSDPNLDDTPDAALAELTPQAIAKLAAGHQRFLSFLEQRVESRAVAEDLLQQAFARAIDRSRELRSDESATAWFYRLLRNALIDHYRRRAVERRALDVLASEPEPHDAELLGTVCACLHDLLSTLRPEYAEAVQHVDLNERSVTSYAEHAGITPNHAGVRLHRARQALHKRLLQSCGTCATHGCLDCHCRT